MFRCLGDRVVCALTDEIHRDYESGRIDKSWLEKRVNHSDQNFYVCGPPAMVTEICDALNELGANPEGMVFEDDE